MTLRTAGFITSSYFSGLWAFLASSHRVLGAGVILAVGAMMTLRLVRSLARASASDAGASSPHASKEFLLQRSVEEHSADPEVPERQRARFLGALGHELRNPLNSITGFSDMLLSGSDGDLNEEQDKSVQTIRASAERLLRLVTTVVDQARVQTGTLRLQQQWVAPAELVSDAVRFVRSRVEEHSLISEVAEGLPRAFVDRQRTTDALVGLCVLVIRSSGADVSVRVASPRRDQVGQGFVQFDLIAHLSDPSVDTLAIVERLERPAARTDALGLEVSVARSVIEAHGGRIWAEAGTAGSLRVCMTLPTSSP
ncbi:MAG: histidine kinase dimerization/phospho-acceptor domain-containing protein [Polyangiales bacterium]